MLNNEDVLYLAKLARLHLNEQEVEKYRTEIGSILSYVDKLKEVDTKDVKPTSQVTGLNNVKGEDLVHTPQATPDELLNCSPLAVEAHQIKVKKII